MEREEANINAVAFNKSLEPNTKENNGDKQDRAHCAGKFYIAHWRGAKLLPSYDLFYKSGNENAVNAHQNDPKPPLFELLLFCK